MPAYDFDSLPDEPLDALVELCPWLINNRALLQEMNADGIEVYVLLRELSSLVPLEIEIPEISFNRNGDPDLSYFFTEIQKIFIDSKIQKHRNAIKKAQEKMSNKILDKYSKYAHKPVHEFSDSDLLRVQELLNELRNEVANSELFDPGHKQRVFSKIESLQQELHQKMSSLDGFWGLLGDAGVAMGKFGANAQPFVARIKEIVEIINRTQARTEGLASSTGCPLLSNTHDQNKT